MSEHGVQAARQAIRELSNEELRSLRSELSALIALSKNTPEPPPDNRVEDVATLVNGELRALGFEGLPTERLRGFCKHYNQTCAALWSFARSAMPYSQRIEHLALLRLGVRMLVKNIDALGIPVTHAVVMRQLGRLPAVVNAGFPGYAQAGLLGLVVRDRTHHA